MIDVEDLSVLARRDALPQEDEKRLQAAIRSSAEIETLHRVGLAIDADSTPQIGDELMLERLVDRAVARGVDVRVARKFPRPRALAIGGATVLCAAAVAASPALPAIGESFERLAASVGYSGGAEEAKQRQAHSKGGPATSSVPRSNPSAPPDGKGTSVTPPLPQPSELGAKEVSSPSFPRKDTSASSPSELFSEATTSRREGDIAKSIQLYRRLVATHPRTAEAISARPILGQLLLGKGELGQAREQFNLYLSAAPSGPLAPECLWGLVQIAKANNDPVALTQLSTNLNQLYPSSVYAKKALKLAEQPPKPANPPSARKTEK